MAQGISPEDSSLHVQIIEPPPVQHEGARSEKAPELDDSIHSASSPDNIDDEEKVRQITDADFNTPKKKVSAHIHTQVTNTNK